MKSARRDREHVIELAPDTLKEFIEGNEHVMVHFVSSPQGRH